MKRLCSLLIITLFCFLGCQSVKPLTYYSDSSYKENLDGEIRKAPLLVQYKFVTPVETHELILIDDQKKQYHIPVRDSQEASEGFVINLPANHQYALASFLITNSKNRKELQLGRELPLFSLSHEKLTRIRGFDIINDQDPKSNSISIAPWDGLTDNLLIIQTAKKFNVPEKSIRTIDIFKKQ